MDADDMVVIFAKRINGVPNHNALAMGPNSCGMMAHMTARLYISRLVFALLITCSGFSRSGDEHWSLASLVDDNSGETIARLQQQSADAIPAESGKEAVHPVMGFQCAPGTDSNIRLRIDWRRFISAFNTEVGFRVDGGKPLWMKLGIDPTNRITMSKPGTHVRELLQRLSDATTVELEVAPYSEPSVFVNFDISTFGSAFSAFQESCQ